MKRYLSTRRVPDSVEFSVIAPAVGRRDCARDGILVRKQPHRSITNEEAEAKLGEAFGLPAVPARRATR
jgi:hypothetical protein